MPPEESTVRDDEDAGGAGTALAAAPQEEEVLPERARMPGFFVTATDTAVGKTAL